MKYYHLPKLKVMREIVCSFCWATSLLCDLGQVTSLLGCNKQIPQFLMLPPNLPLSHSSQEKKKKKKSFSLLPPWSSSQKPNGHSWTLPFHCFPSPIHPQVFLGWQRIPWLSSSFLPHLNHTNPSYIIYLPVEQLFCLQFSPIEIFSAFKILSPKREK